MPNSLPSPDLSQFLPAQVVVLGRAYTYKVPAGMALLPRSHVVVDFGSKGLMVGVVESVNQIPLDPQAKFKYKWIVAALDLKPYQAILATEAAQTVVA